MSYNTQQMRKYQRIRRATLAGFDARRALYVYEQMKARGIYEMEARAAVLSAARDGLFGQIER